MSIYLNNNSVSALVQGYAHTRAGLLVWLAGSERERQQARSGR